MIYNTFIMINGGVNMSEKDNLHRINIRVRMDIADWCKKKAASYAMPYSNYVAMIVTQFVESQIEKELLIDLNNSIHDMKEMSGDVNVSDMLREMREFQNAIEKMDPKGE